MTVERSGATVLSSREFNQDTARAKRAARKGPVFITMRGEATHVLMTIEAYRAIEGKGGGTDPKSLREALVDRVHGDDIKLIIPERRIDPVSPIDLD